MEVIPGTDHFQNGWKSKIHFQRLASGLTDAQAEDLSAYRFDRFKVRTTVPAVSRLDDP